MLHLITLVTLFFNFSFDVMLPNIEFLDITVQWYSFFHWLGVVTASIFGLWYYRKAKFNLSIIQIVGFLFLLYLMMIGGRTIGFIETYMKQGHFPNISVFFAGTAIGNFRWCGSMLAILLFMPVLSRKVLKIKEFNVLFDMLVLCFCILTIFTKQGCQFSGDGCYGVATTLSWGMYYPYGSAPNILPVHPTPIYDSLFHLIFFVLLFRWDKTQKKVAGQTSRIYFITVPIFYILLELIRLNPVLMYGITLPQMIYVLILFSSMLIFRLPVEDKLHSKV